MGTGGTAHREAHTGGRRGRPGPTARPPPPCALHGAAHRATYLQAWHLGLFTRAPLQGAGVHRPCQRARCSRAPPPPPPCAERGIPTAFGVILRAGGWRPRLCRAALAPRGRRAARSPGFPGRFGFTSESEPCDSFPFSIRVGRGLGPGDPNPQASPPPPGGNSEDVPGGLGPGWAPPARSLHPRVPPALPSLFTRVLGQCSGRTRSPVAFVPLTGC